MNSLVYLPSGIFKYNIGHWVDEALVRIFQYSFNLPLPSSSMSCDGLQQQPTWSVVYDLVVLMVRSYLNGSALPYLSGGVGFYS